MALYFVRVRDGGRLVADDDEAQEFSTVEAVRSEVTESAREILCDAVLRGRAGSLDFQIEVTDEAGKTVLTMPVGRVTGTETQT